MYNFYNDIYNYQLNNIIYDHKHDNDGCDDDNFYGGDNFEDRADDNDPDDCCCD